MVSTLNVNLTCFKTVIQTLLGETAHFGFCPPKIGYLGGPGGSPKFFSHWNPNFFVTQESLQNFKTLVQTLLGETAHFGFCPPQIGFFGELGGSPEFFSHWNPIIFVSQEPMQNSKTVAQTILGEMAHFGFCPPKIGFFYGARGGRSPQFFSHWNPNIFDIQEPMQNFKTVGQTLLGETAHFSFCPP